MFDIEPKLVIPEKCQDCGIQCDLGKQLLDMMMQRHILGSAAEDLVGDAGEDFDEIIDRTFPDDKSEEIKTMFRKSAGDSLEEIDNSIESCQDEINANSLACKGVFKIRATKGDVKYTVGICTSPRAYSRDLDTPMHVPVHIRADSATK